MKTIPFRISTTQILTSKRKYSQSLYKMTTVNDNAQVHSHLLKDDGLFPNNEKLQLLIYKNAFNLPKDASNAASTIESVFSANNWGGGWRSKIFTYHHYHSTAHEVLGVYQGNCKVQFGGPTGIEATVTKGDVVIIPAGVAHKCIESSPDFYCVGAYPDGQMYDMNYGKPSERRNAEINIKNVPLPRLDPVFGSNGPMHNLWRIK
jgi:uncharacterized protein YjlB